MKIYIKRSTSGAVNVNPNVANANLSPDAVIQCIANHPINNPLSNPNMANYISLGATGGINFNNPQPGIKIARNGSWIPMKVNYFRTTLASRSSFRFDDGILPSYVRSIDASVRDVSQPSFGTPQIGDTKLKPAPIPAGPPYQVGVGIVHSQVRDGIYPSKLNVSPGASQNVQYENAEQYSLCQWPNVVSNNGFPSASGYLSNTTAVEGIYSMSTLYNKTMFITDPLVATANALDKMVVYQAAACEYLEIEIDDTLVSNIASLANDVFIVIPISTSKVYNYAVPYAPLGSPNDYFVTSNEADQFGNETNSSFEFVVPLSYLINQLNAVPSYTVGRTGSLQTSLIDQVGRYDLNFKILATMAFVPLNEITLLTPSVGGQIGPFV